MKQDIAAIWNLHINSVFVLWNGPVNLDSLAGFTAIVFVFLFPSESASFHSASLCGFLLQPQFGNVLSTRHLSAPSKMVTNHSWNSLFYRVTVLWFNRFWHKSNLSKFTESVLSEWLFFKAKITFVAFHNKTVTWVKVLYFVHSTIHPGRPMWILSL